MYDLEPSMKRWPAALTSFAVPTQRAKPCEVAGLRWRTRDRLSFVVGCDGWHGAVPVLVDVVDSTHWLVDGAGVCRLMRSATDCAAAPNEPFTWKPE